MNKVFICGHLATDPVKSFTSNGFEKSTFSIGVSDLKNFDQSYFFNCVAWNITARYVNENLIKGQLVAIDGRLVSRSYVTNNNEKKYITEITIDTIRVLGSNKKNNKNNLSNYETITNSINSTSQDQSSKVVDIDEIYNQSQQDDIQNDEQTIELDDGLDDWEDIE